MDRNGERRYIGVRRRTPGRFGAEVYDRGTGKNIWLGMFDTALLAALAYDKAARIYNGHRARTNFPLAFEVPDHDDAPPADDKEEEEEDEAVKPHVDLDLKLGPPGGNDTDHRRDAAGRSSRVFEK